MIKPISVFTEINHGETKDWRDNLIHPIRAYWGDGTAEWEKWKLDFDFYKKYFVLSNEPQNSDVAFLPFTLNYYSKYNKIEIFKKFLNKMNEFDKKVFVWVEGDHDVIIDHQNCIFIKYAGYKSNANSNMIIQPGDLKDDLLKKYYNGELKIRKKSDKPSIGFVGVADYSNIKLVLLIIKQSLKKIQYIFQNTIFESGPIIPYLVHRKTSLERIKNIRGLTSDIILRKSFAEGIRSNDVDARLTFINNIINNDYTFCMRGGGNYSLRLYETLCLGRIPLFINTDCILPFENNIDWKGLCLWVEEDDIDKIGQIVSDFHSSISNDEFIERQIQCRKIWEKFLSKEGFAKELNMLITKNLMNKKK